VSRFLKLPSHHLAHPGFRPFDHSAIPASPNIANSRFLNGVLRIGLIDAKGTGKSYEIRRKENIVQAF
jgi:hypothetical protein